MLFGGVELDDTVEGGHAVISYGKFESKLC